MSSRLCRFVLVLLLVSGAPAVFASGFHVYEQGAKASGQAVAFIARADDATAAYYNPAAIVNQDPGVKLDFGFSAIFLGKTKLDSQAGTISATSAGYFTAGQISNGNYDMDDHTPTPIHVGVAYRVPNSPFAVSFALTNPFGLVTDWSSDPNFAGRYAAWKTDLRTFDYQLNGSMAFGGGLAGSVGIDYVYADLRSFSKWVVVPAANPGIQGLSPYFLDNSLQDLKGTGHKIGWNAALHYKGEGWSFGATYKSKIDLTAKGDISFNNINVIDPALGDVLPDAVKSAVISNVALALPSGGASGTLRLPAVWGVGLAYTAIPKWQIELDINRVEWSHFDSIPVAVDNALTVAVPNGLGGHNLMQVNNLVVDESWKSTTSFRLGSSYDIAENQQIRVGLYKESNPIPARTLRPSIPDGDRTGATLGYGIHFGKLGFDMYWLHIFLKDATVNLSDTGATPTADPALALGYYANAAEIGRTGTYKSSIDLLGLTMNYRF